MFGNKICSNAIRANFLQLLLLLVTATISANAMADPRFVEPSQGSTLSSTAQTFTWSLNEAEVERWWLYVGSSVGARDYADSGDLGQDTEYEVIGIPADGSIVHARLWYFNSARWWYIDSSYTAANLDLEVSAPAIVSPVSNSELSGGSARFEWRDNNTLVNYWWLYVGSRQGGRDLYDSGRSIRNQTSVTVDQLPVDGSTVYVRLWSRTIADGWQFADTMYSTGDDEPTGATLAFSSGFESGVTLTDNKLAIEGADSTGYDWRHDLEALPYVRAHYLNHVDGVEGINFKIDLENDPVKSDNRVIAMENIEVVGSPSSRPQGSLVFNFDENNLDASIREFSVSLDIFLGSGFEYVETMELPIGKDGNWFNIFEIWEHNADNPLYDQAGRSRVSVYLEKEQGANRPLYLRAASQKMPAAGFSEVQWSEDNKDVEVPLGRWFTLKAYFKAGGPEDGRFRLSILDSGVEKTVFDIYDTTQNNDEPTAPSAVTAMKNYAAKQLVDALRLQGQSFKIYYDNYQFYEGELR